MKNEPSKISRKKFLKTGLLGTVGILTSQACKPETAKSAVIHTKKRVQWRMITTWPANFPVLGEGCNMLANWVEEMRMVDLR